eukprot:GILI01006162.1.p1 GENE.GILI01006162.1~~GILI01006162.1.p1  ORF type:complete len:407 (+),score=73.41 GILI01006162.1:101-1321(+)
MQTTMPAAKPADLPPHEAPPNMVNSYMTRYDYDYNKGDPPLRPLVADGAESGHSRNRPLFAHPKVEDWKSVSHIHYANRRGPSIPDNLPDIAINAGKSRILATAHIRGQRSRAGVPWNEDPTDSTYQEHYTGKFTTTPNGGNYAGNMTTQYKPNLLSIDSLDDNGVGKAKKPKGWRPEDDLQRPQTISCSRPQNQLTVFGPPNGNGQPWGTEYGTYGNKKLFKPSLLPKGFGDSTFTGDRTMGNKRLLLDGLAGRRAQTATAYGNTFDTDPIPMNPMERDKCRVARRVPLEGPVNMTMYQSDFVRQGNKPELVDAPKDKSKGSQFVNAKAPPEAPKDMHPSITQALERRGMGEIGDRHLHKYHPRAGYSSPEDTMHSATRASLSPTRRVIQGGQGGRGSSIHRIDA